jgi:hypothetical protein
MAEKIVLSYQEYLDRQAKYALDPDNKWYAGKKLGHSPNDEEAAMHFAKEGGAKDFAERYIPADAIPPAKKTT